MKERVDFMLESGTALQPGKHGLAWAKESLYQLACGALLGMEGGSCFFFGVKST